MEQNISSETNGRLTSQGVPRLVWNPKVHYHIHTSPERRNPVQIPKFDPPNNVL